MSATVELKNGIRADLRNLSHMLKYNPERYWSRVAEELNKRGKNYLAGDDDPFHRYKRQKFLDQFLDQIDFQNKKILEVGFGPGGNLLHIAKHQNPKRIFGADISQAMRDIACRNLNRYKNIIELHKINGCSLPFLDQSIDTTFSVTVLQHNTDGKMLRSLVGEMCRVTKDEVVIMEDVGDSERPCNDGSWIDRPVDFYKAMFSEFGYQMTSVDFLRLRITGWWYNKVYERIYKRVFNNSPKEGEPLPRSISMAIRIPMFLTRRLDNYFGNRGEASENSGLAKMIFHRGDCGRA